MKIKIINPVPVIDPDSAQAMETYLQKAVRPGTEIEFTYVKQGYRSVETEAQGIINGAEILRRVMELQEDDCDGIFINCFDDPALIAAREVSQKPVLGPYGSAVSFASLLSERVGIITTDDYGVSCEERKARHYGFENRVAAVKPVELTVLELQEDELIQRLTDCCLEFEKERITAVILGCTGMNQAADQVQAALRGAGSQTQIIEPLKTGVKTLELMIELGCTNTIKSTPIRKEDYVPQGGEVL